MSRHSENTPSRLRTSLGSARVRAVLALGMVLGTGAVGTMAAWTDTATATSGAFSTGSIDLQLNSVQGNPTAYAFTALTKANMTPGQSIAAMLPVQNKGSVAFNYLATVTSTTSTLAPHMRGSTYLGGTATNNATTNVGTCSGTLLKGPVALVSGGTSTGNIIDSRPMVATTGVENICFLVAVDVAAPTTVQGTTVTATFNFTATSA